jgi:hypothetical protein
MTAADCTGRSTWVGSDAAMGGGNSGMARLREQAGCRSAHNA